MDDGGKLDYNSNFNKSVVFNTHSFTSLEVEDMVKQLNKKFDLSCRTKSNKGKKIIVIKNYKIFFLSLVNVYIINETECKLPK